MDELVGLGIVGEGGDDAVNVGVVLHLAAPGVEDGGDAEFEGRGMPSRFSAAWGFEFCCAEVVEGLAQGDAGALPPTPDTGEEPVNIAMGLPKGAQSDEQRGGDGDLTGLPSLAVADADDEALRVDVLGLEREGFA